MTGSGRTSHSPKRRERFAELRGCFVTGTDTGVGKTVLAAAITAGARARGIDVAALKPVMTGLDELAPPGWPADHELLARAAGSTAAEVALTTYGPPVSPHLAAELAGRPIDPLSLLEANPGGRGADTSWRWSREWAGCSCRSALATTSAGWRPR